MIALVNHMKGPQVLAAPEPKLATGTVTAPGPVEGYVERTARCGPEERAGVVGISEIDTRALTRHLRSRGAMRGIISTESGDPAALAGRAGRSRSMVGADLASEVELGDIARRLRQGVYFRSPLP